MVGDPVRLAGAHHLIKHRPNSVPHFRPALAHAPTEIGGMLVALPELATKRERCMRYHYYPIATVVYLHNRSVRDAGHKASYLDELLAKEANDWEVRREAYANCDLERARVTSELHDLHTTQITAPHSKDRVTNKTTISTRYAAFSQQHVTKPPRCARQQEKGTDIAPSKI